jgi:hypothetical protein
MQHLRREASQQKETSLIVARESHHAQDRSLARSLDRSIDRSDRESKEPQSKTAPIPEDQAPLAFCVFVLC